LCVRVDSVIFCSVRFSKICAQISIQFAINWTPNRWYCCTVADKLTENCLSKGTILFLRNVSHVKGTLTSQSRPNLFS